MTVFGVDLSDFDWGRGPVDVAAMARDGIVFLTHKATEGVSVRHQHLAEALDRARAAGIEFVGAYHVVRSVDAGAQVRWYLAYLDEAVPWWRSFPGFFHQVDLEAWSYDRVSAGTGMAFAKALLAAQPRTVITYASRGQYGDQLTGIGTELWNANYGRDPIAHYRAAYPGDDSSRWAAYSGRTPVILQYGSRLTIGSQPGCDANAFRGGVAQLRALIEGGTMGDFTNPGYADALAWRMDALLHLHDKVAGGPTKNEPAEAVGLLRQAATDIAAVRAGQGTPVPVALTDADRVDIAAKLAALLPAVPTAAEIAVAVLDEQHRRDAA